MSKRTLTLLLLLLLALVFSGCDDSSEESTDTSADLAGDTDPSDTDPADVEEDVPEDTDPSDTPEDSDPSDTTEDTDPADTPEDTEPEDVVEDTDPGDVEEDTDPGDVEEDMVVMSDVKFTEHPNLGAILTDADGNTLYLFAKDVPSAGSSACEGGCLGAWPVFYAEEIDEMMADDFDSFERADGQMQSTYRGWPLYYYSSDAAPGDATGDGVGAVWWVVPETFYDITVMEHEIHGIYAADADGFSLYVFSNDTPAMDGQAAMSACEGGCLSTWPVFYAPDATSVSGVTPEDLGSFERADGQMQSTYRGYPLYYYSPDVAPGEIGGHEAGDVWFLFEPFTFMGLP